jgi:hypothetical protein
VLINLSEESQSKSVPLTEAKDQVKLGLLLSLIQAAWIRHMPVALTIYAER